MGRDSPLGGEERSNFDGSAGSVKIRPDSGMSERFHGSRHTVLAGQSRRARDARPAAWLP